MSSSDGRSSLPFAFSENVFSIWCFASGLVLIFQLLKRPTVGDWTCEWGDQRQRTNKEAAEEETNSNNLH